jgi:hypothetical protein
MKPLIWVLVWIAIGPMTTLGQSAAKAKLPLFVIRRPTVIAFFPVTQAEVDLVPDGNEALNDFQYYAGTVKAPLIAAGIDFHEDYARAFRLRAGKKVWTVYAHDPGYYFVLPGKEPHTEHGVMTDTDILAVARKYFGIATR